MSNKTTTNIYDFIEDEIKDYEKPKGIRLDEGWSWSMKDHLHHSYLYLNSQFVEQNENRTLRPFKNIITGIMNLQYRTVDFDVKDIELFVDNPDEYFKSLLIKKYHNTWALENKIDTFIDNMILSYSNYGGVLVRKTSETTPEVIKLRDLAFCNQTNILAYPFAIKHTFSSAQLRKANKNWGIGNCGATTDIETLISMVKKEGKKEIEVYEVHGLMPKDWVGGDNESEYYDENTKDVHQIQIVSFYKNEDNDNKGVTLFRKQYKDIDQFFKFLARDEVEGRALGRGGVEELFEPQQWTNKNEIWITEMLDAASKNIFWSDDPKFKGKNNLMDVENNEVLSIQQGRTIQQLNTFPRNLMVFNDSVERWQERARELGSAPESLTGKSPSSGTPFKLYEAEQIEGKSMHIYRQGKLAVFLDEIYRDWVLPHLAKEIVKEKIFKQELSTDEVQEVVNNVVIQKANDFKKRMILGMQDVNEELVEDYKNQVRDDTIKKGNKRFFQILEDEMKDVELSVMTNIAGKQKNLALLTDKLVNVLRQYIATPQIRQDPEMTKILNTILESSGMSPMMFGSSPLPVQAQTMVQPQQGGGSTQPLQQLGQEQVK